MRLLDYTGAFWVEEASLDELDEAARAIEAWTDEVAALLDHVYFTRTVRLLEKTRVESAEPALALAEHLSHVAHDGARDALDALDQPYFARWRMLQEMLMHVAERIEVPEEVLGRKHVLDILHALARAGGRLPQRDLAMIANEGQRSSTLKLMETWDLVERVPGPGNTRVVLLTELGRVAIGETLAAAAAAAAAAEGPVTALPLGKRFCELMSVATA